MIKGTVTNKDSFLNHVAKSLGRPRTSTRIEKPVWKYSPQQEVFKGYSQDELVKVLKLQGERIHTDVIETLVKDLPRALENVVMGYGGDSVVTWADPRFEEFGLTMLLNEGLPSKQVDVHVWDTELGDKNTEIAERANVGITFSDTTLAESGTVVLFNGKGKGRAVSLLPATYIAIIPKSTIVPRMTQVAEKVHRDNQNGEQVASCVNFISGPSNSADIEMNLIVGVHGPIKATYIIVNDK
ncbi:L-lactate dehydrogenase complex protein LldG [Evansella caseinilytica]|uniref:Lactate utilization protein C n=1 Tax=Evansella caseinilytica TaxID=1503961 RepID=A0A1H3V043_9BACI|nr:lactate utilization protein C [Evansella caseinilytica]SDZ67601.1 L-lactate dehydrogenase complex protein LldG [Evansella caseinilytica]